MKTNRSLLPSFFTIATILFLTGGCGTTTGNGRITVESASYSTAGFLGAFQALSSSVTDFKVCVKKIQLKNDQDEIKKKDGEDDLDFPAGLIDLSSGASTSWGTVTVPVGFTLKRVKIHIHKDQDLCGIDYSLKYNAYTSNKNLEIKHIFDPVIELKEGDTLQLSFQSLVNALRKAVDEGSLSNDSLKDKVEEVESSAKRK